MPQRALRSCLTHPPDHLALLRVRQGGPSRGSTPVALTPRNSPGPAHLPKDPQATAAADGEDPSSSDLEPSPLGAHALPVAGPSAPAQPPAPPRQSRGPRRTYANDEEEMAPERAASVTRARPRLPRPPPRPRSAPPSKVIKSRFADSSAIDIFRMDAGPPPETFDDVEKLRKAEWTDEVIQREQATDVLSQGRWYRVPEKTIRLDFWSKIGGETPDVGGFNKASSSMARINSAPSMPRATDFGTPETDVEDSFGPPGGDFSDSENANGKRPRYDGPLFGGKKMPGSGGSQRIQTITGLDGGMNKMVIGSSSGGSQVPSSLTHPLRLDAPLTSITQASAVQRAGSRPPSSPTPDQAGPSFVHAPIPRQAMARSPSFDDHPHRNDSPAPASTSATAPASQPHLSPPTTSAAGTPATLTPHPLNSPTLSHNLPRASSPLRFSSTSGALPGGPPPPLPRSSLAVVATGGGDDSGSGSNTPSPAVPAFSSRIADAAAQAADAGAPAP